MTDNQLVEIVEQSNLPKPKVQTLMETFAPAFSEAKQIVAAARDIKVTSEDDTAGMQLARENRLKLKEIRVSIEKTRKELKEQSLREGRAIDGAANIIKALIVPAEEHLQAQEKYAELLEEKRLAERYQKRLNDLALYVEDTSLYKLKEMSEAAFENLLRDCKTAHEQKVEAEKKAEQERIAKEKLQKVFTERRIELAPYQEFVQDGFNLTVDTTEAEYKKVLEVAKQLKAKHADEQAKIAAQAEKDRKAKEEAEAALKKAKELEEKKALEEKAAAERQKQLEEAEQKAKEKAEREAMLAPDANKLFQLAADLEVIKLPAVKSNEAQKLINQTERKLQELSNWLHGEAKKL